MGIREAARASGVPEGTGLSWYWRARKRAKERLAAKEAGQ